MVSASGTYAFSPSLGELALQAFARIGIHRANVSREQLQDAQNETNLMFSAWANSGPNLWAVDQLSTVLVAGQASYAVDPATVMILDGRLSSGTPSIDRVVTQVSRTDYASYANKAQQAPPTVFWFDRLLAPTVTFWPVPDSNGPYTFSYYRARQQQDAAMAGGLGVDAPYRFLDALVWGLAERLAYIYAPDRVPIVAQRAMAAYKAAADQDTEDVPVRFAFSFGSFYR